MKRSVTILFTAGLAFTLTFLLSFTHRPVPMHKTPEDREDNAWEMFQWWYNQRAFPYELIPQGAFEKAAAYARTKMKREARGPYSTAATPSWVSLGPNNVGGRTLSIALDPSNPNIVWAGSASGGLWKSATGGEGASAWSYVSTGYPTLSVSAISIDPSNANLIYIGTGEISLYHRPQNGTPGARSSYGMGILKSTNGGLTWAQTSLTWAFSQITAVQKIAINPLNTKTLYAATSEGVYKSTDAGANWLASDTALMAMDVAINPADTTILYATHGNLNSTPVNGLFKSTNAGGTWLRDSAGLPSTNFGRAVISICASHPSTVYLGIANASSGASFGLYRSDDDGVTWSQASNANYTGGQGWYDIAVAVNPNDRLTVFSSGLDIWRSTSGGASLTEKSFWFQGDMGAVPPGGPEGPSSYAHADHHAIVFDPAHPDTIYFACDGGVFKSTDGGNTYLGCNGGYVTTQFYNGFANALADSQIALGGLQDNGAVRYEGTTTWNKVDGGDGGWSAIDPTNAGILYDEYVYLSLKKSVGGGGFNSITTGLPGGSTVSNFIAPFVISHSNPAILYAGNLDVYKTTNGGSSWFAPNGGANLNGTKVACIGVSYTSSDTLLAATGSGGVADSPLFQVFGSTNGGQTWTNVTGSLPNRYPTDIEFDPGVSSTVYITFSGYGTGHLFKSTNVGQSWTDITSNLPDIPHQSVVVDPVQPQNIYAGTDLGVYHSSNGGTLWEDFSSGMVPAMVLDMTVSRSNNALRAATFGNGVYERKLVRVALLALQAPVGGEVLLGGQPSLIKWSEQLVSAVKIEYSTNDGGTWNLVADNVPGASGQYAWTVPSVTTTHARVRISESGTGTPTDSSPNSFTIDANADVVDGWNLISLRLLPPDPPKSVIFPTATSPAFTYAASSGYSVRDSLSPGEGFWMKFSGAQLTPYAGDSISTDTIPLRAGWNLVGSLSEAVAVSSVIQIPGGNVRSPYYGYSGSYLIATSLQPGQGYWVRAGADGKIVLHSGSTSSPSSTQLAVDFGSFTSLLIGDAGGRSQTLYLAPGADRSASFALPPVPPEGGFDARFSGGNLVEFPDANSRPNSRKDIPILISTTLFPVTISWTIQPGMPGASLLVDGRVIGMRGSGSATIPGPQSSVSVRIAEQETKPVQYSLGQNYPNPFNPKTVFPFVLAHPSVVTLKVYDIGGREVATLLSRQSMGMGRQQAEFDASMLSSGVYLYRLIAEPAGGDKTGEGFEGVRKMLLLR